MSFVLITVEKNSSRVGLSLLPSLLFLVTSGPCHFLKTFPAVWIVWIFPSLELNALHWQALFKHGRVEPSFTSSVFEEGCGLPKVTFF